MDQQAVAHDLCAFIRTSSSQFQVVQSIRARLEPAGFVCVAEQDPWTVAPGSALIICRNASSVVAVRVGAEVTPESLRFQLVACHPDSPSFKLKAQPEIAGPGGYRRLDVEPYGGMIDYSWFDRPLSLAGRVLVRTACGIESRLYAPDRDLCVIPSMAVHLQRDVNQGFAPNRARDLMPLWSAGALGEGGFVAMVAADLGVEVEDVLSWDLYLANRVPACVWGAADEFVSGPKLDDLQCVHAALCAFGAARNERAVTVFACLDNEEVGSGTKQGALSTLLSDALERLATQLGATREQYLRALARSFLVSADNAQAVHPAHDELYDAHNRCVLNGGPVIKEAASQKYTTDAVSRAVFAEICARADVPCQTYANRSDLRGGSTLGNLSNMQVSVHAVDIGLPQLAMHSAWETAGALDSAWGLAALRAFYEADLRIYGAERVELG